MVMVGMYQYSSRSSADVSAQFPPESPERLARIRGMAENWPKQPDFRDRFNPLNPAANVSGDSKNQNSLAVLPTDANGADELVTAYCSGCHSLDIVTQQHASRDRWQQLLIWMEEKQGMPKLPEKEEAQILNYLSVHFSS